MSCVGVYVGSDRDFGALKGWLGILLFYYLSNFEKRVNFGEIGCMKKIIVFLMLLGGLTVFARGKEHPLTATVMSFRIGAMTAGWEEANRRVYALKTASGGIEVAFASRGPGNAPALPIGQVVSYRADDRYAYILIDGKERRFYIVSVRPN